MAAKAAAKAVAPAAGGAGTATWLLGAICGAAFAFATPSAILAGILLAPVVLAAVFDTERRRPVARVVFVAAAGFTVGPVWHLNMAEPSVAQALDMLCDPAILCPPWLAGGFGWGVCVLLPMVLSRAVEQRATAQIHSLQAEQKALREAWDLSE